jgi:exopolysaccharide biosynthesis polyprenyl glycosylphosphotransferase
MPAKRTYPRTQHLLLVLQFGGDVIVSLLGLCLGYWVRFNSPMRRIGVEAINPDFGTYSPLLMMGAILLLGSYAFLKLYDARLLLRPHRSISIIIRGTFFWFLLFLGTSLILKFQPAISRLFVATSCLTTLVCMIGWRYAFYGVLSRSKWRERMTQRVAVVGWNGEAAKLADAIFQDQNHPYAVHGVLTTPGTETQVGRDQRILGRWQDLDAILTQHEIDIVVMADLDLTRHELLQIASLCERRYVDFKVIPSFFQIFVSNLRMQTVSGVPLLGIEQIPLHSLSNRALKRAVDIIGALVGLFFSIPIMGVLAVLIRREGPGPIFFRQIRTGRNGENFPIYKMRSMKVDAERGTGPAWAVENDPRRLKIGAFMREWNLDEIPQFWNVLIGDMSLVGPRPERPELIKQFEHEIPHYNPRHEVRPGITGWAQVNGLRGNTSLVDRIQYDLYYIENWSLWLDVQIMILTFFRRKNAY